MSRQDANAAFARTSFLYGGNADYIEDLHARYESDPQAVDAEWRRFFQSLKDERADVLQGAAGRPGSGRTGRSRRAASWLPRSTATGARSRRRSATRSRRARQARASSFPPPHVQQATRDSIHALMLIRAYRARGHFYANLDPLGSSRPERAGPRSALLRLHDADMDRKIFLDRVLGLEFGTLREILTIVRRTYCQTLGVEFMHISNPAQKGWMQERIEGPRQGDQLHPRGQARDPQQAGRGGRLREILRSEVHRHQALRPRRRRVDDPGAGTDHQARRRARREGDRVRHGAPRPAQRAGAGDGQAAPRDLPRVQGRLLDSRTRSKAPAT
jgi:2-oxoglutarate dehydrogenase E1 component